MTLLGTRVREESCVEERARVLSGALGGPPLLRTAGRRGQGRGLGMVRAAGASKGSCPAGS